ncbi:NACHT domain-containing protein [Candidatus Viridilinea mediisalina]|uniref:NACHT domain-containing protein n=1 Tax=Candidatus Viridilinea mediisalina TaxID=2024553 RepID=A0A2A6RH63_9CHLR|nr:SUMF1/EgtB/PvdO family nonheme iron enzyme [Candidatus Viridilinea mediisalina]PDW02464.1 hypothetical protein CJ255_13735 [Candidatus Viridilinea mediisalina]
MPEPSIQRLRAELAQLDQALVTLAGMPAAQALLQQQRDAKAAELARLQQMLPTSGSAINQSNQAGGVNMGVNNTLQGPTHIGDAVARDKLEQRVDTIGAGRDAFVATQQTIHIYYGDQPPTNAARLLSNYLAYFAAECNHLRLQRIANPVKGQQDVDQSAVPELRLQAVYTSLTTNGPRVVRLRTSTTAGRVRRFLKRLEKIKRGPDDVRPEQVIMVGFASLAAKERKGTQQHGGALAPLRQHGQGDALPFDKLRDRLPKGVGGESHSGPPEALSATMLEHAELTGIDDATLLIVELQRPELAIEAIALQRWLVLLGDPGSGKSTVLRYLGHLLARRACGAHLVLPGWPDDATPIPILIPLAQVAEQLGKTHDPDVALWQTLGNILNGPQGASVGLLESLREAMHRGGVILLCDGLDELSAEGGEASPRSVISHALQRLVARTPVRIVITSRVLPYQSAGSWQLPQDEGWQVRTLTPLAFGQVKTFVRSWFRALADFDPDLTIQRAKQTADALIEQLVARPALQPLIASPLLLTMLTLLHNNDRVPEQEVDLYEQCVLLLLERWEPVRQPGLKRPGLIERLGNPPGLTLPLLRNPLHQLAYEAHRDARGEEGRGVISDDMLHARLVKFFDRMSLPDPLGAYKTFTRILAEEAGLLIARGDETFAFPHLSFQEYLAACYLAADPKMRDLAHAAWQSDDRERWRKVLVLLAGRLTAQDKARDQGFLWLKRLWSDVKRVKSPAQRSQDARLAALTYQGMGGRAAFAVSDELDLEAEIERPLRRALCALFTTRDAMVPAADRLMAGRILGELGDPRYPVSEDAWRKSLMHPSTVLTDQGEHYWRYVPAGTYRIGGWDGKGATTEHTLPPFWIARLPITVAQFARFVTEGYRDDSYWTTNGLGWRGKYTAPYEWGNPHFSTVNHPVVFVTWYEATAFCAWLGSQVATALPTGHTLRLPSEAEWEAAAAFAGPEERREYPWGSAVPTPEHAVYDAWQRNTPAPVGLCPAGMAACGAMDLAGNVWEWMSNSYKTYPEGSATLEQDFTPDKFDVPIRGGSCWNDSTSVRCGARGRLHPSFRVNSRGFRVVISAQARTNIHG